jgi:hypothetical protein
MEKIASITNGAASEAVLVPDGVVGVTQGA